MEQLHSNFNQELIDFIAKSPTPFHAVENLRAMFDKSGFKPLIESESWQLEIGNSYYVTRNDSSIIAFVYGGKPEANGFRLVGAHTDSPCLKVKPQPEITFQNYFQLGVEVYGGVLLNPWFDRDLSIAGRVTYKTGDGQIKSDLIDFKSAIATIPSLAIHLDREANKERNINPQTDIIPLILQFPEEQTLDFRDMLLNMLIKQYPDCNADTVLDYELSLYDTQLPAVVGLNKDFISSARLDNLLSCFVGAKSICEANKDLNCLLVCNDHEEVGSMSSSGAQGPFLINILERIIPNSEDRKRCIDLSMLISTDNAHGIHPNYQDKHDEKHGPIINKGPVIKINNNQRYATNSITSSVFRQICQLSDVPVQCFVSRNDMGCGSTIGPITAGIIGVKTIDVGVPTFAMHSIRELAGSWDSYYLYRALAKFYNESSLNI